MSNKQTVVEIYEAFGRGDVSAILEKLSDSVEWEYSGSSNEVPWLMLRRGKKEVAEFFTAVNELEFRKFVPKEILEGENIVISVLDIEATLKKNGESFAEEDEIHVWRFDSEGKVIRFRHGVDTYRHHLVYHSESKKSESVNS